MAQRLDKKLTEQKKHFGMCFTGGMEDEIETCNKDAEIGQTPKTEGVARIKGLRKYVSNALVVGPAVNLVVKPVEKGLEWLCGNKRKKACRIAGKYFGKYSKKERVVVWEGVSCTTFQSLVDDKIKSGAKLEISDTDLAKLAKHAVDQIMKHVCSGKELEFSVEAIMAVVFTEKEKSNMRKFLELIRLKKREGYTIEIEGNKVSTSNVYSQVVKVNPAVDSENSGIAEEFIKNDPELRDERVDEGVKALDKKMDTTHGNQQRLLQVAESSVAATKEVHGAVVSGNEKINIVLTEVKVEVTKLVANIPNDQPEAGTIITEPDRDYIPSEFSNKILLDPQVFRKVTIEGHRDVFVFKNLDRSALEEITRREDVIRTWGPTIKSLNCNHLLLEKNEFGSEHQNWEKLVELWNPKGIPLHLVEKQQHDYVLVDSTCVTDLILHHQCYDKRRDKDYSSEADFITQFLSNKQKQVAIIYNALGTGIGPLKNSLAWKLQGIDNTIPLIVDAECLKALPEGPNKNTTLKCMLEKAYTSKHTAGQVYDVAILPGGPVVVFLLELKDNLPEKELEALLLLTELINVRLLLFCSSPNTRRSLEQTFRVIANDMREAGRENQMKSLHESFAKDPNSMSGDCIAEYVKKVIGDGPNSDNVYNYHVYKALDWKSPKLAPRFKTLVSLRTPTNAEIEQVGLLNGQGEFIYSSFRDHFMAQCYIPFWSGDEKYEQNFAADIVVDFIKKVSCTNPKSMSEVLEYFYKKVEGDSMSKQTKLCRFANQFLFLFDKNAMIRNKSYTVEWLESMLPKHKLKTYKMLLSRNLFPVLLACVEEGLNYLLGLILNLSYLLFTEEEIENLLSCPEKCHISPKSRPCGFTLVLQKAVEKNSPEAARDLFKLVGNRLYTEELYLPLIEAIENTDLDTFHYLIRNIPAPADPLLLMCLHSGKQMTEQDISARVEMFETILSKHPTVSFPVSSQGLEQHLNYMTNVPFTNLVRLWELALDKDFSLYALPRLVKRFYLFYAPVLPGDDVLVNLLELLFCKPGAPRTSVLKRIPTRNENHVSGKIVAADVLKNLDLAEARETFTKVPKIGTQNCFYNTPQEETLKILLELCPDFAQCNEIRSHYPHYAVYNGHKRWIEYLKHDMNVTDKFDNTPLMYIRPKGAVQVTRQLLSLNVDVKAVNKYNQNVAHRLFLQCTSNDIPELIEWVTLMLDEGHADLFRQRDIWMKTPFEFLLYSIGDDNQVIKMLRPHVPDHKVLILKHAVYNYDHHRIMNVLRREFGLKETHTLGGKVKNTFSERSKSVPCLVSLNLEAQVNAPLDVDSFLATLDLESAREALSKLQNYTPFRLLYTTQFEKNLTLALMEYNLPRPSYLTQDIPTEENITKYKADLSLSMRTFRPEYLLFPYVAFAQVENPETLQVISRICPELATCRNSVVEYLDLALNPVRETLTKIQYNIAYPPDFFLNARGMQQTIFEQRKSLLDIHCLEMIKTHPKNTRKSCSK